MSIFGRPVVDSKAASAAVAAPGVAATVVTLGILPAGTYKVSAVVVNTGTAETTAAGLANMGIYHGSTLVSALPTIGTPVRQEFERITVNGAESISVKSIAAAVASSMYVASLSAVRLGG
jgi:hypothetical protein